MLGRAGRAGGKRGTGDAGVGRRWSWPAKEKEERAEVEVYGPNGEGDRGLDSGWTGFGSSFSISSFLSSFFFSKLHTTYLNSNLNLNSTLALNK